MQYGKLPLHEPENVYVVSDIHNESGKLQSLLTQFLPEVGPSDHIVFSGDLINRGPNAAGVFLGAKKLRLAYPGRVFFIEANHEEMFKTYLKGSMMWRRYLVPTLESIQNTFGLGEQTPAAIREWLDSDPEYYIHHLIPYYETKDLIVTHAPIDSFRCDDYNIEDEPEGILDRMNYDIKWNFIPEDQKVHEEIKKYLICGHQYPRDSSGPRIHKKRAFIDGGCGKGPEGKCTALRYPDLKFWQA